LSVLTLKLPVQWPNHLHLDNTAKLRTKLIE
jgi:hypothetical protein